MIKITGHPIRHKKRIQEMQARFLDSGEDVEVEYKNQNHILITNENRESKDQQGKAESE
jgi:antitoxin component of MazEF toxin-antitoxin module